MMVLGTSPQWGKKAAGEALRGAKFKKNASAEPADMWVRGDGDVVYTSNERLSEKGFDLVVENARGLFKRGSSFRRPANLERFGDLRAGERFDMPPMFAAKPFRPAGDLRKVSARQFALVTGGARESLPANTWVIPYQRPYVPNARTYLDPSGWHVFNLGTDLGYAVVAPYHQGTLVTFRRKMPGAYPLLLARWRHLRTDPLIQRYASKSGAQRALKSFQGKACRIMKGGRYRGGMMCP